MGNDAVSDLEKPKMPLTSVLSTLGQEFSDLGLLAHQLQTVLSPALLAVAHDTDCHKNIQMLDLFSQRLNALSAFVTTMGGSLPLSWEIDSEAALRVVSLSKLAWRLQGEHMPEPHVESGELDLF